MKRVLLICLLPALMFAGCSSLRQGTSRMDRPLAKIEGDEPKMPEIVVREEKVKAIEEQGPDTFYRYYVIIGSFRVLDNARTYKVDLKKDGFKAVILENENGLYRISVGAYQDETAARKQIADIRYQFEKYDDVWLLIRKK